MNDKKMEVINRIRIKNDLYWCGMREDILEKIEKDWTPEMGDYENYDCVFHSAGCNVKVYNTFYFKDGEVIVMGY